jgi:hypothetical protein
MDILINNQLNNKKKNIYLLIDTYNESLNS